MTTKKSDRKISRAVKIGLLILACAAGLALYFIRPFWRPPVLPTGHGLFFEELMPQDINVVFSFNPSDNDEQNRFEQLVKTVAKEKADAFLPTIAGLFIKQELSEIIDKNSKFLLAFENIANNISPRPAYFLAETVNADFARNDYAKKLPLSKIVASSDSTILVKTGNLHYGVAGDVVFFTDAGEENAKEILRRYKNNFGKKLFNKSLANNKLFRKAMDSMQTSFSGYLFTSRNNAFSITALLSQENGLEIKTTSVLKKKSSADRQKDDSISLYKNAPILNSMIFGNTDNAADILAYASIENLLTQAAKNLQMNYTREIKPLFNQEMAFSVQNGTSVLPKISLFINTDKTRDKALRLINALNANMPTWLSLVNMSLRGKNLPVAQSANFTRLQNGLIIKFYLNRIPTDIADIPLFQNMQEPIEISYGMTDQNILFISTAPNFENIFLSNGSSVEHNPLMQDTLSLMPAPSNVFFINFDSIVGFAQTVIDFAKQQKRLSENEEAAFLTLKKYFGAVKSFVWAAKQAEGNRQEATGFLTIQR